MSTIRRFGVGLLPLVVGGLFAASGLAQPTAAGPETHSTTAAAPRPSEPSGTPSGAAQSPATTSRVDDAKRGREAARTPAATGPKAAPRPGAATSVSPSGPSPDTRRKSPFHPEWLGLGPQDLCPEGHGSPDIVQAFWVVGDDRDNPEVMRRLAREVSRRIRCVGTRRPILLHGGDSFSASWYDDGDDTRQEAVSAWKPLKTAHPGLRFLLAPGNHEGVEGALALSRALGEPDREPFMSYVASPLRFLVVNTEDDALVEDGEGPQASWLRVVLAEARTAGQLPVVIMHRPPSGLSCGHHRYDIELKIWDQHLSSILVESGTAGLVIGAHDHLYLRATLAEFWTGLVVGNGGAPLSARRECPGVIYLHAPTHAERSAMRKGTVDPLRYYGYLECLAVKDRLSCKAINLRGAVVDRFSLPVRPDDLARGRGAR